MTTFRWLHLTDLHLGMPGQQSLWPNVEEMFLENLDHLRTQVGPWDLVLFTGDITQRGTELEFDEVDKLLQKLWSRFKGWGFVPKLLAIPGNHDLVRPIDESDPTLITLLYNWHLPAVQTPFWEKGDSPQRQLVSAAFQGFSEWWEKTPIPKPEGFDAGLLPGDCSASFEPDGFSLGIVGLNSAYLQLAGGDFEGRLHLDARQLHAACDGHGADWTKRHDACLLLTHHPVEWLTPEAQKHFVDEIHSPPERFALHLFGHMHEADFTTVARGGGGERRRLQGRSLFGLENWGEKQSKREHGYSLCELKLEDGELRLRIWPRRAIDKPGGGRKLERDVSSFTLEERDGGTRPVVVKQFDRPCIVSPGYGAAPSPPRDAAVSHDPRNRPFYIPYRQKGDHVIGREEALAKVRQQLTVGRRTAIGQVAVSGPGRSGQDPVGGGIRLPLWR